MRGMVELRIRIAELVCIWVDGRSARWDLRVGRGRVSVGFESRIAVVRIAIERVSNPRIEMGNVDEMVSFGIGSSSRCWLHRRMVLGLGPSGSGRLRS